MLNSKIPEVYTKAIFLIALSLCLTPFVNGGLALITGLVLALSVGNPYAVLCQRYTSRLLQLSVVGLGAGMNLAVIAQVGAQGIGYTAAGIVLTLGLGLLVGRILKVGANTSLLLSVGTAICGGSAIAAVAPTIRAKSEEVSVALVTVFFLNALALLIFPSIGHWLGLSERAFGLWSALAIHDTSSVVGASMQYGQHALEVATTVKLARALWIVPVTFVIGLLWKQGHSAGKKAEAKRPWFILGYILTAAFFTFFPALQTAGQTISSVAKQALVVTLFLIGAGMTPAALRKVGVKPLIQGLVLWVVVASATIGALKLGWIS